MIHLLKLEWLKIRKYRAFLILLGFFIVSIFGINYIAFVTVKPTADNMGIVEMIIGNPFLFPTVWHTVSYFSSFLLFIPGLIIILFTANEYSFRTHRQNVIDGLSRWQFIGAKIALMFVIALFMTLLVAIMAALLGVSQGSSFSLEGIEYIGYFFINAVAYMSVALVLIVLFKRSSVSIGIYFLYAFIVENLLSLIINTQILPGTGCYLPLESSDKLIPAPSAIGDVFSVTSPDTVYLLIASFVWILLCLGFCKYRFERSDL